MTYTKYQLAIIVAIPTITQVFSNTDTDVWP